MRYLAQISVALALAATLVAAMRVQRFYSDSPRFCESCHNVAPEISLWLESEHRDVHCQSCHHTSLEDGLRILVATVTGQETSTRHGGVSVASCSQCHAHHDKRWPDIANSLGHRLHVVEGDVECVACHGRQMHFGRPVRTTCLGCHEGRDRGLAHEESHCLACHNFLSTEENHFIPGRRECLHCHLRQDHPIVISNTAPMRFICSGCHRPHAGDQITPCRDCHPADELHGHHRTGGHAATDDPRDCLPCHAPHTWMSGEAPCRACHDSNPSHHPEGGCLKCHSFERDGVDGGKP